jgi:transglutaminase-like putative cysteine protease
MSASLRLRIGCEFHFASDFPVPMLMLVEIARSEPRVQPLYQSRWLQPDVQLRDYRDSFGNTVWRLTAPGGALTVRYDALVDVDRTPDPVCPALAQVPPQDLPDDALVFTLPSRFVESDLLGNAAWDLFGNTPATWDRVQAICDWVHTNIRYEAGSSGPTTTARDIFVSRVGVCRDFAVLPVAFCRALNIPARYTFGYLPDVDVVPPDVAMDFHAWFEAFLGGRWFAFDARHNQPRVGRVVIGRGRDVADVALSTSYGAVRLESMTVWAEESTMDAQTLASTEPDADALEAQDR